MTTMAPEAPPAPTAAPPAQGKRGNVFTRKLGPLPMWVWLAIGLVIILGYVVYRSRTSAASSAQDQTAAGTDASQVPQFVNQTYTTVQPPTVAAPVTATGGTPTTTGPQPSPVPGRPPLKPDTRYSERVGQGGITLATFAKRHKWNAEFTRQVEALNKLKPGSRLKKGQQLIVPA